MDFVNKNFAQLAELFRSMTIMARITTGLLLAVLSVSLGFLFQRQTEIADTYLFNAEPLTQREINMMTRAFSDATLNDWNVENFKIKVPRARRHAYMAALSEANAYPEHPGSSWEEMFNSESPFVSGEVRKLKAKQAKEREMASTVRAITGIEEALVDFDEIDKGGMPPRKEKRALVSVRAHGNEMLDDHLVRSIASAVAFGAGLDTGNVTVLDLNTGIAIAGKGKEGASADEDTYARAQRKYEKHYRDKISNLLAMIKGMRVNVYVDLDKNLKTSVESQSFEGQPVAFHTEESSKDITTSKPTNQGRPGVASNVVGNTGVTIDEPESSDESTHSETRAETDNLAGSRREFSIIPGLVPKYVKVAIMIPRGYFEEVWKRENAEADGTLPATIDKTGLAEVETRITAEIQDAVDGVIPESPPGVDKFPRINVKTFTETPIAAIAAPGIVEAATSWLSYNWSTLGMFLLAGLGLFFLRSILNTSQPDAADETAEAISNMTLLPDPPVDEPEEESLDEVELSNTLKARFQNSERSLRDELSELVREDPSAAANVLQGWIGEAA